ncbi:MAG: hypothetical protein JWP19_2246 [Rhodoglobus sp.]|nr:hypothetical protein [Rhodoglobus sp.]
MNSSDFIFSRLYLPAPLPVEQVQLFLERLAIDSSTDNIVFEARSDASGIQHLLGCSTTQMHHVRHLLTELIPGALLTGLDGYLRPASDAAGRITIEPPVLPLADDDAVRVTRAVFSSLSRKMKADESLALQVTIGAGRGPAVTPHTIPDPSGSWLWQALTGAKPAQTEVRNRVRDRAANITLQASVRIGVASPDSDRRRSLATDLLQALRTAESPGVSIGLTREKPALIDDPSDARYRLHLSVIDLMALMGWPLGEDRLPGMPSAHPKRLRPASGVHTKSRLFAESISPGDTRQLGLAAADALLHSLVIGPTGVGKTNALYHLIASDIQAGYGVVVLDPKDQMPAHIEARIPKERWKDVVHIDPGAPDPIGFNPLDTTNRDPDVVADGVLAVFAKSFADSWGPRTADIFSASLRTLARTSTAETPSTLVDLPRLWTDASFRRKQLARLDDDPGLMSFWAAYESLGPAAQANWIASPMNKLRSILLRPAAVKILGQPKPRFRLRDAFRERKIVLVSLNEGLIGPLTAELIGSLLIAELWQATQERASEKDAAQKPAYIYVDEADRFMHLPISLGDALARSRSLSVGWTLAVQYWEQLPREMRSAVKSNARSKIVFHLSSDDDARTFAKLAPGLADQDFMSLGRYEVYVDLVAAGINTGWASARTLPPSAATSDPAAVRRVSQSLYGPIPEPTPTVASSLSDVESAASDPDAFGRRRRQS